MFTHQSSRTSSPPIGLTPDVKPNDLRLDRGCPTCNAPPGADCRTHQGTRLAGPHRRLYAPLRADQRAHVIGYDESGIPTIAVEHRGGLLVFKCEHCARGEHTHGDAGEAGPDFGDRASHCPAGGWSLGYRLVDAEVAQ
jgi:hypothetical protein